MFLFAQSLEDFVEQYSSENSQDYVQPLANVFGANLNSGIYRSAHIPISGIHIRLGFIGSLAYIPEDQKEFYATTEGAFQPVSQSTAPTIFGASIGPKIEGIDGTVYAFPGGFEIDRMPLVVPQVSIGSLYGTEAIVRFYQMDLTGDIGELSFIGYGLRHSLNGYFPGLPVDLSAHVFTQNIKVADIVEASALSVGVEASNWLQQDMKRALLY